MQVAYLGIITPAGFWVLGIDVTPTADSTKRRSPAEGICAPIVAAHVGLQLLQI